jgi:hypothetical protein
VTVGVLVGVGDGGGEAVGVTVGVLVGVGVGGIEISDIHSGVPRVVKLIP